jgi:16S rRNA (cytosine1402-N4)-methyltransferase
LIVVKKNFHLPVMSKEIIENLKLEPGKIIVDATLGTGGHSLEILKHIMPGGRLIGIDKDTDSLKVAKDRLKDFQGAVGLVYGDFRNIDSILQGLGIENIDGVLFDLGISSYQLEDAQRGFSFSAEGPLDMRMDRTSFISAYDLINNLNEEELSSLLWSFGQERWHNRIAHLLVQERQRSPISTTSQLSSLVLKAMPHRLGYYKIHPATRTFQAIRIAVNRELEALDEAIKKSIDLLKPAGRICVISFHSLEDRIIKWTFRRLAGSQIINIITKKPMISSLQEKSINPSSRSAKLRVAEKA